MPPKEKTNSRRQSARLQKSKAVSSVSTKRKRSGKTINDSKQPESKRSKDEPPQDERDVIRELEQQVAKLDTENAKLHKQVDVLFDTINDFRSVAIEAPAYDSLINALIKHSFDVNRFHTRNEATFLEISETPLMAAASAGRVNAVKRMLAAKADVNVRGPRTALHAALVPCSSDMCNDAVVKLLLDANADPNVGFDDLGHWYTPLYFALQKKPEHRLTLVQLLVKARAKVNVMLADMYITPLQYAAGAADADLTRLLLRARASVNRVGRDQRSALQCAVDNDDDEIVRLLLERRADVDLIEAGDETSDEIRALLHAHGWMG